MPFKHDWTYNESEFFSGKLSEKGVGVTYQRMLWKGLFTNAPIRNGYVHHPRGPILLPYYRHGGYDPVHFGFLFVWQLPHYLILLYKHAEDYEQAGFVTFFAGLKPSRFAGLIYAGFAGTGILAAWLAFSGLVPQWRFKVVTLGLTLFVLMDFLKLRDPGWKDLSSGRAFVKINVYGLAVFLCILMSAALFGAARFSEYALTRF